MMVEESKAWGKNGDEGGKVSADCFYGWLDPGQAGRSKAANQLIHNVRPLMSVSVKSLTITSTTHTASRSVF